MKKIKLFAFVFVIIVPVLFAKEWFEGGTLHKSKIKDWQIATYENRIATAADFIASTLNIIDYSKTIELVTCINQATKDLNITYEINTSEIAVSCIIILGWK